MSELGLHGSPNTREAPLSWHPSRPEEHMGEIIDVDQSAYQVASIDDWFRPLSKVELGVVNRKFEEIKNKQLEGGEYQRDKAYREAFEKAPQHWFTKMLTETSRDDWKIRLDEALETIKQIQNALAEKKSAQSGNLRGGMGTFNMGRMGNLNEEASNALGGLLRQMTNSAELDAKLEAKINTALGQITDTRITINTELLSANAVTKYDNLSEVTKGFIFQEFLAYMKKFDEGTDQRTATLHTLIEMRKDSPYKVFDGRDRFVYDAWQQGLEVVEELKSENDPRKRAELERRLEEYKDTVRMWTSTITGGYYNNRAELGPVGLRQAVNSAWAKVQHTINRLRGADGKPKFTLVMQSASHGDNSWEAQYLESDIYLQFGTTWNAYQRLDQFNQTEHDNVRDAYFNPLNKEKWDDLQKKIDSTTERKIDDVGTLFSDAHKRIRDLVDEPGQLTERLAETNADISRTTSYLEAINERMVQPIETESEDEEDESTAGGGGRTRRKKKKGSTSAGALKTLREERDTFRAERDSLVKRKAEIEARQRVVESEARSAAAELIRLNEKYDWYTPMDPDGNVGGTDNTPESVRQARETYMQSERQKALARFTDEATKNYAAFQEKLKDYVRSINYKDYQSHFTNPEIEALGYLTGMGVNYNEKTGKNEFAPEMAEHGTAELNLKIKKVDPATGMVIKDAKGEDTYDERKIDTNFSGDYVFFNPSKIPEWEGRLSVEYMEQVFRNPERDPAIKQLIDYAKSNNKILIVTTFPVKLENDGGMVEANAVQTGRALRIDRVQKLKALHGWKNIDVYREWLENPRIQEELGIRPEEMLTRIISDRARIHSWQRELLDGATVINLNNSVTIPAGKHDAPLSFEYMMLRQFEKFGRLSAEDVDEIGMYQALPRTNELAFTYNKADNTREIHWRNEILTNNETAPQTELDGLYQAIANQLDFYENRTRYYNNSRRISGPKDYDEIVKTGAYIKAHMDLIANKKLRLKALYLNPDATLTIEEKTKLLNEFRDKEMAHLSYEILDARGKPKLGQRNRELWEYYNGTAQWLGKLKRNERESRERYVITAVNEHAHEMGPGGVSAYQLAEADYNYNKDERLSWEMETYAMGLEALGMTQNMDNKGSAALLADRYVAIKSEQLGQTEERTFRAMRGYDYDLGPDPSSIGEWASRAIGTMATHAATDVMRKMILRINMMAQENGIDLHLPADRFMLNLRPDQIAEMIRMKDDNQLTTRLARRMGNRMKTGAQETIWDIFSPTDSNLLYKDAYSPGLGWDETGKALYEGWQTRVRDDFFDAIDRWFLMYGSEILQDARVSGMPIRQILNTIENAGMNDNAVMEVGLDGRPQINPHGKKGTKLSVADAVLFNLSMESAGRPTLDRMPDDNIFVRKTRNNPTVVEQYYDDLARKAA